MKTTKVLGVIASICLLAACTQETSSETATTQAANEPTASVAEASAEVPDKVKGASIAIVQNTGQGDYFQQYLNGTRQQAAALGLELSVYDAQGDNSTQASQLDQAIASGAKGSLFATVSPIPCALASIKPSNRASPWSLTMSKFSSAPRKLFKPSSRISSWLPWCWI